METTASDPRPGGCSTAVAPRKCHRVGAALKDDVAAIVQVVILVDDVDAAAAGTVDGNRREGVDAIVAEDVIRDPALETAQSQFRGESARSAGDLLFFSATEDNVSLGVYRPATGAIASLGPGSEGQFSPDGQWLLSGGQDGIVARRVHESGAQIQIAGYGGSQPRGRRDGREIFYVTGDRKLMAVGFDPATGQATAPRAMFVTRGSWRPPWPDSNMTWHLTVVF
jgi:hypothetical protein